MLLSFPQTLDPGFQILLFHWISHLHSRFSSTSFWSQIESPTSPHSPPFLLSETRPFLDSSRVGATFDLLPCQVPQPTVTSLWGKLLRYFSDSIVLCVLLHGQAASLIRSISPQLDFRISLLSDLLASYHYYFLTAWLIVPKDDITNSLPDRVFQWLIISHQSKNQLPILAFRIP